MYLAVMFRATPPNSKRLFFQHPTAAGGKKDHLFITFSDALTRPFLCKCNRPCFVLRRRENR